MLTAPFLSTGTTEVMGRPFHLCFFFPPADHRPFPVTADAGNRAAKISCTNRVCFPIQPRTDDR
jgi:hypothetical protein